jgi:GT2 family glycosyltransferase
MGQGCAVVPSAVVDHVGGASFAGKSDFAEFLMARNQWWVLIKNIPTALLLPAVLGYAALQLMSAIARPNAHRRRGLKEALARTGEFLDSRRRVQSARKISAGRMNRWLSWSLGAFLRKESPVRWR